jgi:hypothetical protein
MNFFQGSLDGVSCDRWLLLGVARTRALEMLLKIDAVQGKRVSFVKQMFNHDMMQNLALGVPIGTEHSDDERMDYFSNTDLLQRHVTIAKKLLTLLYRCHQFSRNPEPIPLVFYNWLVPSGMGRESHDKTNMMMRFLKLTREVPFGTNDACPLLFGLVCFLLSQPIEELNTHWLQPCLEQVALQLWLAPKHLSYNSEIVPYDVTGNLLMQNAAEWYGKCPALLEGFLSKYHVRLTTNNRVPKQQHKEGDLFFRLHKAFVDHLPEAHLPADNSHARLFKRWLTLFTLYRLGGEERLMQNISIHQLISKVHVVCTLKD